VLAPPESACPSSRAIQFRGLRLFGLTLLFSRLLSAAAAQASEVCFSPNGGVPRGMVRAIQESGRSLDVAVYNITAVDLAEALSAAKVRGLRSWVLVDQEKAEEDRSGPRRLRGNGVAVCSPGVVERSLMHHKVAIFHARLVGAGADTLTNSAEHNYCESLVVLDEPVVLARFQREFRRLERAATE